MNNNLKNTGLKRLMTTALVLLLCIVPALAQVQVKVTGTVVDNLGVPMIGVSILEKGTTNGVVTDLDGNYTLNAAVEGTLVFSYVGYVTQEHPVKEGTLNVTMEEDSETLDELVETLTQKKLGFYDGRIFALDWNGFYRPLEALLDHYVHTGMLEQKHRDMISFCSTPEEILDITEKIR